MALNYVEKNNNKNRAAVFQEIFAESTKSNNFCNNVSALFAYKSSFSHEFSTVYWEKLY